MYKYILVCLCTEELISLCHIYKFNLISQCLYFCVVILLILNVLIQTYKNKNAIIGQYICYIISAIMIFTLKSPLAEVKI